jgi:ubiquinone/menaquinone biosynthesis C-methylase UbiE
LSYDSIAEAFDRHVREEPVMHELSISTLLELCPAGRRVLDLACGQGILARTLASRGYAVTGVDISGRLLEIARHYETAGPLGVTYVEDDASSLAMFPDGSFDGVASNLAITDIDDLPATMKSVARVLAPDGWFVFAFPHPCFYAPYVRWVEVDGQKGKLVSQYFEEGRWWPKNAEARLLGKVGSYHRTLSTVLDSVIESGLVLDRIVEPPATYVTLAEILVIRAIKRTHR